MKILRKILCCMFAFLVLFSFSACKKKQTNTNTNNNQQQQQQNNPGEENPPENPDPSDPDDPDPPEPVVALTSSEMLELCSNMASAFLNNYEFDNESDFDSFINENKTLFLNVSGLVEKIDDCNDEVVDFEYNKWLKGYAYGYDCLENKDDVEYSDWLADDQSDSSSPYIINKFNIQYNNYQDDETKKANAISTTEINIMFGYRGKDVEYTYDYFNIYLETSNVTKDISAECYIEKSVAGGVQNSTATYYVFKFDGKFGESSTVDTYEFYKFDRTEKITNSLTMININYIQNYEQSSFDGETETYFDPDNTNSTINSGNEESANQIEIIKNIVDWINGKVGTASAASAGYPRENLSKLLVPYDSTTIKVG